MTFEETYNLLTDRTQPARTRCKIALTDTLGRKRNQATRIYNQRFDNTTYLRATLGRSVTYCNALIDEALAYCGHPDYKVHPYRRWSAAALEHLARFVGYRA